MPVTNNESSELEEIPVFLHLTKTAGGTLKSAIQKSTNLNTAFIQGQKLSQPTENAEADIQLYYGHSVFGIHESLGVAPSYYTFVRHPIRRTVSHYYHLYNVDKSHVGDKIRQSSNINEFFETASHWEFDNFMCRIISGLGADRECEKELIFERAKSNIDKYFKYVGFQEFFPESVVKLEELLDCTIPIEKNINIGSYNRAEISSDTFSKVEELNVFDMQLYKYCIEKYL